MLERHTRALPKLHYHLIEYRLYVWAHKLYCIQILLSRQKRDNYWKRSDNWLYRPLPRGAKWVSCNIPSLQSFQNYFQRLLFFQRRDIGRSIPFGIQSIQLQVSSTRWWMLYYYKKHKGTRPELCESQIRSKNRNNSDSFQSLSSQRKPYIFSWLPNNQPN